MTKFLLIPFIILFSKSYLLAQDKIYLKDSTVIESKVVGISSLEIKYKLFPPIDSTIHAVQKYKVVKILYANGLEDVFNYSIGYDPDSMPLTKNFFRIYFTDILFNKFCFGYERLIGKKYSIEIDAFYKYAFFRSFGPYPKNWTSYFYHQSEGAEIRFGISRHFNVVESRISLGFAAAYRQQSFSQQIFYALNGKYSPDVGVYNISQTKKGIGLLFKFNFQINPQESGFEFFLMPGTYASITKNQYNWYNIDGNIRITDPADIPKLKTSYMKDGFALLPYLNFGFDYTIKQPQKGWYKKIVHKRDSLKFKRKNIFLFNTTELTDDAYGFTYGRVIYKHALSLFAAYSYCPKNGSSKFSNSILREKNANYTVSHKNTDISLSASFNFFPDQQSFPFLGISGRFAQFEGSYERAQFTLNKYYVYLNSGYVERTYNGFSYMMSLALGHYYNDYLSNKPWEFIQRHNNIATRSVINSFQVSVQAGYSF